MKADVIALTIPFAPNAMKKTPHAHRLPSTAEPPPPLAQLLAAALAENELLAKLVDELRRAIVAPRREHAL